MAAINSIRRRSNGRMNAVWFASIATAFNLTGTAICAGDEAPQHQVLAHDLLKSITVIGALGKPLGTLTTIRGVWRPVRWKNAEFVFRVSQIDSKPTKAIVEFTDKTIRPSFSAGGPATAGGTSWDWKAGNNGKATPPKTAQIQDGEEWEMLGAERGDLVADFSEQYWDVLGIPMASRPIGFESDFTFIAVRRFQRKK